MFIWLNKQGVKSDQGFEVQSIDRFTIEYTEKNKRISVSVERGYNAGRPCVIIENNVFEKWDDGECISPKRQAQIKKNFKKAMEFQGVSIE